MSMMMLRSFDNIIVDRRMRTVYKNMLKKDYRRAIYVLKSTIALMDSMAVCNKELRSTVEKKMYAALIHLIARQYDAVHEYVRDVHYLIQKNKDSNEEVPLWM